MYSFDYKLSRLNFLRLSNKKWYTEVQNSKFRYVFLGFNLVVEYYLLKYCISDFLGKVKAPEQ